MRHLLVVTAVLCGIALSACGTDSGTVAAEPTSIALPTHTPVPIPEKIIDRAEATDIALEKIREGWASLGHAPGPATDIRDVTVRFMSMVEFEQLHDAVGSGWSSGPGYGANNHVWVVQARADSKLGKPGTSRDDITLRYAIEAINATTGRFSASARTVAEPYFISAEINHPGMPGSESLADPTTPTKISREQVRKIIEGDRGGYKSSQIDRMEIELVEAPDGGNIWWVYIPSELGSSCSGSGGPDTGDGRHLWCLGSASWNFVDAESGTIFEGENFGRSLYRLTNAEVQALHRFAWAEGWWELWHQLKPYTSEALPEGFAASLDRPDAPTPTPGPPTPTPDPSLPPRPTPTPAPRATAAPTPTPAPSSLRRDDDWIPESPSTSINKTFEFGMAIKTPEDMQIRFDAWPDKYKIEITPELVVFFAYEHPVIDWAGLAFINHIPSFSSVILDRDGKEKGNSHINSEEAKVAISALLANEETMREIVQQIRFIDAYTFGP